jgi:DNA processing protein
MGGVSERVLLARAYLSRVAEPASIPVWRAVCERGPVAVADELAAGAAEGDLAAATPRAASADAAADLEVAERHGVRLVVPESAEWPHFALSSLEAAGVRRVQRWDGGDRKVAEHGEPIPPLALWVRGAGTLESLGVRSVAIVGSRASTPYGNHVTSELAAGLARREFTVVSGGAYGIDAAAHRAALAVGEPTVIVSAGGLDRAYPAANTALFDLAAADGLVISESPPGSAPQRRRFLTRNRLIAALGTGSLVVEAAQRSGAMNTASHARRLRRPVMAVPGPVTSAMSAGCHALLAAEEFPATLVTCVDDVLPVIGRLSDLDLSAPARPRRGTPLQQKLDDLDPTSRRVFDCLPAYGWVQADELACATGVSASSVVSALPVLEAQGLVTADGTGHRVSAEVVAALTRGQRGRPDGSPPPG